MLIIPSPAGKPQNFPSKKLISQNKDNFLIKEAKNVISFHAKNVTGEVKEQKKLEFHLPSALLQKSIVVTEFLSLVMVPPVWCTAACCQMNWKVQKVPFNSLHCFPARRMLAHGQHRCHCWLLHWHQCPCRPSPLFHSCHWRPRAKF